MVKKCKRKNIETVYGKKKPVARIVPINGASRKKKPKFGLMDGKIEIVFAENFKMTDDELLDLKE
jgi:antitoxin (DNA-binding transcriptional repressor) of toxin-antitoxin stability system